jgi:hypothetical protein
MDESLVGSDPTLSVKRNVSVVREPREMSRSPVIDGVLQDGGVRPLNLGVNAHGRSRLAAQTLSQMPFHME